MAITQLTDAGAALLAANTGPITLTAFKLGSAVNYVPEPTDTNIHGSVVVQGAPSSPVAMSANVVKYGVYLDYGTGPHSFGELGLFTSDNTLFALVAWNELISKLPVTAEGTGNSIRIDVYLSVNGQNYDMWLDLASSSNVFRMAILGSVDLLPQSQDATPNAYVVSGLSQFQSSFIAYTDRAGLWNFDAYDFAAQATATVTGFTGQSVTIALDDFAADMNPNYLGQVIVEFTTGGLYSTCRYVESTITVGDHVTFGFDTPIMKMPVAGDKIVVWVRRVATTQIPLPIATHSNLGGVIVGQSLTVDGAGLLDVDYTKIQFPVKTVAGRTGDIVLTAADVGGLATVATTGSYNDLSNKPAPYSLPVATTSILGGVKAPSSGRLTIAVDGTIDLGSTLVTSVAGRTGAVVLTAGDISGLATVATSGSYTDLTNKPTIPGPYTLPPATVSALGGVIVGSGLAVNGSGVLSVTASYTLPVATSVVLGGVKQGANVTIAGDGTLSVAAPYSLPVASTTVLGGVKQGTGVSIAGDGTLSVTAAGAVTSVSGQTGAVVVQASDNNAATGTTLIANNGSTTGNIKLKTIVAGSNVTLGSDVNGNLQINSSSYALPTASASTLGGVKVGSGLAIAGDGTLSSTLSAPVTSVSGQTGAVVISAADANTASGTSLITNSGQTTGNITLKRLVAGSNVSITADGNGNLVVANTAAAYTLPVATSSVLGGVKQGSGVTIAGDGTLSVNASGVTTFNTRSGAVTLNGTDITNAGGALASDVAAAKYYDVPGGAPGTMTASQIIGKHTFVRAVTFPANFAGSQSHATAGATGSVTITLTNQAGTTLGTMVIAASGTTATFASTGGTQVVMAAGQTIIATAPATADATLANFTFTLLGLAT